MFRVYSIKHICVTNGSAVTVFPASSATSINVTKGFRHKPEAPCINAGKSLPKFICNSFGFLLQNQLQSRSVSLSKSPVQHYAKTVYV